MKILNFHSSILTWVQNSQYFYLLCHLKFFGEDSKPSDVSDRLKLDEFNYLWVLISII